MNSEYALILGLLTLGAVGTLGEIGEGLSDGSDQLTQSMSLAGEDYPEEGAPSPEVSPEDPGAGAGEEEPGDEDLAIRPLRLKPRGGQAWDQVRRRIQRNSRYPLDAAWALEAQQRAQEAHAGNERFRETALEAARDYTGGLRERQAQELARAARQEAGIQDWKARLAAAEPSELRELRKQKRAWDHAQKQERKTLQRARKQWKRDQFAQRRDLRQTWSAYERAERKAAQDFLRSWRTWRKKEAQRLRT